MLSRCFIFYVYSLIADLDSFFWFNVFLFYRDVYQLFHLAALNVSAHLGGAE